MAVTSAGSAGYQPALTKGGFLVPESSGIYYSLSMSYTVNSGTCKLRSANYVNTGSSIDQTLSGSGTVNVVHKSSSGGSTSVAMYFDGRNTFNLSIHSITVTKHPTLAIAQDYSDGNHLLEVTDSAGKTMSGVLSAQGSGETESSIYTSDFSAGEDGWIATNGTVDGNIDSIDGEDNWLRLTGSSAIAQHRINHTGYDLSISSLVRIYFRYFIPSGQSLDSVHFRTGFSQIVGDFQNTTGTATDTIVLGTVTDSNGVRFIVMDGTVTNFNAAGELMYVKNIAIKQVTAPSTSGATLVDEIAGTTQNLFDVEDGFAYNEASYTCTVKQILPYSWAPTDIPASEAHYLQRFWASTDGPNWTDYTWDFDTATTAGELDGVTVSGGHVTQLDLSGDSTIEGDCTDLQYLTSLTALYLHNTSVSGDISGFDALTSLTRLYLYSTSVSGDISGFDALTSLTVLHLYNTSVSGDVVLLQPLVNLTGTNTWEGGRLDNTNISSYTSAGDLPAWSCYINVSDLGLSQSDVDDFLVDLDNGGGTDGVLVIDGTNAAPSGTGDAAVTSLEGKSWTVTTS
jgi:hypothetical protein